MRLIILLSVFACASPCLAQTRYPIAPAEAVPERIVAPGKPHTYTIVLPANHFVSGAADQRSADVIVKVFDPTGRQLGFWDGPARGDETFKFNTVVAGEHRIEISAFERDSGAYALRIMRAEPFATNPVARVAQIMSDYDSTTPGGVVAVVRAGKVLFARGYGMANLEHRIPNTPETIYHMASVSKQFTAFAILLLAEQGKLSIDDDIRKHLPELHDFGTPVTIRHLVHHTSGLRDQWTLWAMAGGRLDDVITHADLMNLIRRQKELNFAPGTENLYSNTGYTLLSEIVARVANEPFGVWMKRNVFDPLGMRHTQIYDDHERLVKGRADSYRRRQSGEWSKSVLSYANRGATSLFTTASDLALWLDNFRTGQVGGRRVLEHMKQRGVLNKGDTIAYAFGIVHGKQRGLATIGHGGADAGFRTNIVYYPAIDAGVITLGNETAFNPVQVGSDVAEAFFADRMTASPAPSPAPQPTPPPQPAPWTPTAAELQAYTGVYYSPELETRYEVLIDKGNLIARHRRHGDIAMRPAHADNFRAPPWYFSEIKFERDAHGKVTGMRVSSGRVRNLLFQRLAPNEWADLARYRQANAELAEPAPSERRVVFMGNSITESWAKLFPTQFPGKPYIGRGISGQTTPQMLVRFRQDVLELRPDVVVVLAGTNDIAGNTGVSTLAMIEDNIKSMTELAQANGLQVVLCSVLPVFDYPWKKGLEPAPKIVALNAWLKDYAGKVGAVYVDFHTPMADARQGLRADLGADGVHPNEAGYRIMAPLVEAGISRALKKKVTQRR